MITANTQQTDTNSQVKEQHERALLRERFLRLISYLSGGQKCKLKLYGNEDHMCQTRGFHPHFETILVDNLQTNYPEPIPKAVIRANDILSMYFESCSLD